MTNAERIELMRKRQAYFSAIAEEYTSLADFVKAQDMWMSLMGVELTEYSKYITLYIQLDFAEYEQYYIINSDDGTLTVSDIIMWKDNYCCNSWLNISTGEEADEEDIPNFY